MPELTQAKIAPRHYSRAPITEALIDIRATVPPDVTIEDLRFGHREIEADYPKMASRLDFHGIFSAGDRIGATAQQDIVGSVFFSVASQMTFFGMTKRSGDSTVGGYLDSPSARPAWKLQTGDGRILDFDLRHEPLDLNYSHSEIVCLKKNSGRELNIPRKVRKEYRARLSQAARPIIPAAAED